MTACFFDSSALAKKYLREAGSEWVRMQIDPLNGHRIVVSRLAEVEVASALNRRQAESLLTVQNFEAALADLHLDVASHFENVEVNAGLVAAARVLVIRYGLRAYDAVQLASAISCSQQRAGGATFVSADQRLNVAAFNQGLSVINPVTALL